jgi:hypothetical protein
MSTTKRGLRLSGQADDGIDALVYARSGVAGADTETERDVSAGGRCLLRYDGSCDGDGEGVELAGVGC